MTGRPYLFLGAALLAAAIRAEAPSVPPAASTAPAAGAPAQPSQPFSWRKEVNQAFRAGESLTYVIKYGFISGGQAGLEVVSTEPIHGRPAYHIISQARTNNAMDVIFKVRDLNESWMDVESLCSHHYHQIMREGHYFREVETRFDHPNGHFVYWKKVRKGEGTEQGSMPPFVHDVLTSLYYLRTRTLTPGETIVMDVNSGAQTWTLKVNVKGIEKVSVPLGKFECYRVEPLIAGEGLFMQTGNLEVWLTTDARRVPVLMRSKVMVGAFTAELIQDQPPRTP